MNVQPLNTKEAQKARRGETFTAKCMWFAGCKAPAVSLVAHPAIGEVPVCAKHEEFAKS